MARIHGSRGSVLIDPAGGVTYVAVASLNSWDLDMSRDTVDVTAFGDTNKQAVLGLPNFSGNYSGFYDSTTTPTAVFDVVLGSVAVGLKLMPDTAASTHFYSGLAYLSGKISVSSSGAVTIGGGFVAAGNWTQQP